MNKQVYPTRWGLANSGFSGEEDEQNQQRDVSALVCQTLSDAGSKCPDTSIRKRVIMCNSLDLADTSQ